MKSRMESRMEVEWRGMESRGLESRGLSKNPGGREGIY